MTFVQEFQKLLLEKPRYNLKQVNVENCDYADIVLKSRNCYYSFGAMDSEDLLYSRYSRKCTSSNDMTFCSNCEWCYECVACSGCYMTDYSQNCQNCAECKFCIDCFGCTNCFGCIGLYKKQYCFFNKQLTKEEYEREIQKYDLTDPQTIEKIKREMEKLKNSAIRLATHQYMTEDCIGENLSECKNCYECYDSFKLEDCLYVIEANTNKDCMDFNVGFDNEKCYSCVQSPFNFDCNFLFHTDQTSESEFCAYSKNLKNCFGCVYLSNKQFYILNKPYSEEEYKQKVAQIKQELIAANMYNMLSYFASNYETHRYQTETDPVIASFPPFQILNQSTMNAQQTILQCTDVNCKKKFLAVPQELKFYENKKLPLPTFCPACRQKQRMALRSERTLYNRTCDHCKKITISIYPPESPYKVYCQKCFWENIG